MFLPQFNKFYSTLVLFFLFYGSNARYINSNTIDNKQAAISRTITVNQNGQGDFKTIQEAIDSVPSNNTLWTLILINAGLYKEKVRVPQEKPFLVLKGESSKTTFIEWGEAGPLSGALTVDGENFIAANIAIKNTYNLDGSKKSVEPAAAVVITGDKGSFHQCSFIGMQDTFSDIKGRHYFDSCYFEGVVDFIWGYGQSIYKGCAINATVSALGPGRGGVIAAQGREKPTDTSGFVFVDCTIDGDGPVELGRAYREYSRVIFKDTFMSKFVQPEGWDAWDKPVQSITFSEIGCKGPGADKSKRVQWEKELTPEEVTELTDVNTFINQDGWLEKQPKF